MTAAPADRASALRSRHKLPSTAVFGLLAAVTSVLLFAVGLFAARSMSTSDFSLFASLSGLLVLLGVLFTAVQTFVAGGIARGTIVGSRSLVRVTGPIAVVTIGSCGITVAPAAAALHADILDVLLIAVAAVGLLVFAVHLGVLQGAARLAAIGTLNAVQAALRLGAVGSGIALGGVTQVFALTALVVWFCAGASILLSFRQLRAVAQQRIEAASTPPAFLLTLVMTMAIGAPTVGDVLIARILLPPNEAGAWATVAIVGRVLVFLAAILATAVYPVFLRAQDGQESKVALTRTIVLLGASLVLGAGTSAIAPGLVLRIVADRVDPVAAQLLVPYLIASAAAGVVALLGYRALASGRRLVSAVGLPLFALVFVSTPVFGLVIDGTPGAAWLVAAVTVPAAALIASATLRRPLVAK